MSSIVAELGDTARLLSWLVHNEVIYRSVIQVLFCLELVWSHAKLILRKVAMLFLKVNKQHWDQVGLGSYGNAGGKEKKSRTDN